MKKIYIIGLSLVVIIFSSFALGFESDPKTIPVSREFQAMVDQLGQKQELVIPNDPLEFDSTFTWDLGITKKSLSAEKSPAYFLIEDLSAPNKKPERRTAPGSGSVAIPKGTRFKVTICAGEYSRLLSKTGAGVKLKLSYTEAHIKYAQGDQPYQFHFEVEGPSGFNNWNWQWTGSDSADGQKVTHQFESDGKIPIIVVGKGKTSSGLTSGRYYFELEVPPLIVLSPKVEPLQGPVELNVKAQANSVVNYGQKVVYTWNFDNGVELSGVEAGNIYIKPGKYHLNLTAKVNDYSFGKSWLVEVTPLTVSPNPVVTPILGPVPLEVNGSVNPVISGSPVQIVYTWDVAGETVEENSFKHSFTEPGDYRVLLKTEDKLHPNLVFPEEVIKVKATPPQITINPTVSVTKGIIPLPANFTVGTEVKGSPVELVYFWDFGDGEYSNVEKPTHVFKKPGKFQVRLIASDRLHPGNLVSSVLPMEILPPEMKLTASPSVTTGLVPLTVNFRSQVSTTGTPCDPIYNWNFGDNETSVEQNPGHVFKQEGKYTVTLEVKDRAHSSNTVKTTLQIEVKMPKLRLTASVTPTSGKAPLTVDCRAWGDKEGNVKSELKYTWDFGDGTTGEGTEQTHTYEKPGTYNVVVTVVDEELGISDKKTIKVTVKNS
jgi:PKD repeat protein